MRNPLILAGAVIASACATTECPPPQPPKAPTVATWDEAAAAELRAFHQKTDAAFLAGDLEAVKAMMAEDGFQPSFDLDMQGQPIKFGTREEFLRFVEQMFADMKAKGMQMKMETKAADCRATSTLGTCVAEMEMSAPMPDGTPMRMSLWGTGTARRGDDGWRWTHWHGSYAKLPPPPAPPAPPPAPMLPPTTAKEKEARWQDSPGGKGVKIAILWQSPQTRDSVALVQIPRKFEGGHHLHSASSHIWVTKGDFTITYADGSKHALKAGSYHYAPANAVHAASSKKGATFVARSDGPFDETPTDDKGNPIK